MQILIIGGFGYIGSQLLDSLADHPAWRDVPIAVVDNWAYGRGMAPVMAYFRERLPRLACHCLDVSDPNEDRLKGLVAESTHIVNLASLTQIPNSPLHDRYIVGGATRLADLILAAGNDLTKAIDISSTSIYGPVRDAMPEVAEPYPETLYPDPDIALHDYAASKLRAERVWRSERCRGIPFTVFRLSTVFGWAVGMRYNQFVNQFLVDAVAGRPTVLPGGPDDYRPHVHVRDAARLMLHLFEAAPETNGEILNVGAERLNPRLDALYDGLADMLARDFGIRAEYTFAAAIGRDTIQESYRVDFSKFERKVAFPLEHDFLSGGRELVEKVRGG